MNMTIEEIKEVVDLSLVESIKEKDKRIEELDKVNSLLQLRLAQERENGELLAYNCEKRAREQMIDKACEWLKEYIGHGHLVRMHHPEGLPFERICTELSVFIPTFTKAMKGE